MSEFTYCSNADKSNFCLECKRNINLDEVEFDTWLSGFNLKEVKNFKTKKSSYSCDGFIKKGK